MDSMLITKVLTAVSLIGGIIKIVIMLKRGNYRGPKLPDFVITVIFTLLSLSLFLTVFIGSSTSEIAQAVIYIAVVIFILLIIIGITNFVRKSNL